MPHADFLPRPAPIVLALAACLAFGAPARAQDAAGASVAHDSPPASAAMRADSPVNMDTDVLFFQSGSDRLTPDSSARLEALADVLKTEVMAGACLLLVGHSDTAGPEALNMQISRKRAERVREMLLERLGPDRMEIAVEARGESEPLEGEPGVSPRNRRVVIWARRCA
ncbi:Outer membrane porin F precursor [Pseudoruegeria aquimaris]|uniref:Outer membrane porin F n=1 Tax=Pseudoruegeria aquimaris TaxID=393663 RepID=A0A1Y5TEK8_9RHOB|nr:OmpA family protein [Pseudoruegeria aquimaris]SLN62060.1 Outer membrane porin F precursor [Pseudoruegeria aquimaris]